MTSIKSCGFVFVMALVMAQSVPLDTTTSRSRFVDSIEKTDNQLMEFKKITDDLVLDTRTPPKIKLQAKKKDKPQPVIEHSHAGIAIPMDEDSLKFEETTKKLNFYKIQRPTTNSGLSTWIFLGGETSPTTPVSMNKNDTEDLKVIEIGGSRIVKPLFKKRITTKKPQSTTEESKTTEATTKQPRPTPNMVKIKTSILSNLHKKNNNTKTIGTSIKEVTEHPTKTIKTTTMSMKPTFTTTEKTTTQALKIVGKHTDAPSINTRTTISVKSENLPLESKDGETSITETPTNNKKKKNKNKKNKNKNRRKKPEDKITNTNSTKTTKLKNALKEKPISTQLYNYLSREMMPTIGVGLVGLMVTAGLASYFLYPFGIARRSYEIDRKDKEGSYYYNDIYSGGIAEEEALGKVIAGMPINKLQNNIYKTPTTRKTVATTSYQIPPNNYYQHQKSQNHLNPQNHHLNPQNHHLNPQNHHQNRHGLVQGTVESVPLSSNKDSYLVNPYENDSYQPITYKNNEIDTKKEAEISIDKKFVVGNVPKSIEEITPAAVPEHGPRMLRFRKKRQINDSENDIDNDTSNKVTETSSLSTTEKNIEIESSTSKIEFSTTTEKNATDALDLDNKVQSVVSLVKDIFHLKLNLGLEIVKNATRSISTYIDKVQKRLDTHYRNSQKNFTL